MLYNPFKNLKKREWFLWLFSFAVVAVSNVITGKAEPVTLLGTLTGVTALIFMAKGDVWGQILSVVFSIMYAISSYKMRYYGEMITYLGMTMPISALSVITWLKNPAEKGKNVVKIHKLTKWQKVMAVVFTFSVTWIFYFILKAFNTANLFFSTISITTSFLAAYLSVYRNSYYAVAYAANDVVLIILWILATMQDVAYFPIIICFVMFLINDLYGFICWKKREKKQGFS